MDQDAIRSYWVQQARAHGRSHAASWSDLRVIELEVAEIARRLTEGDRVLDVGCANGFSSLQLARAHAIVLRGLDFVPEMIKNARANLNAVRSVLRGDVIFEVGDILSLEEADGAYDKVIVTRVLINLESWDRQVRALGECARVLRSGGTLMLSEATVQWWTRLNRLRAEWGLPDIPMPAFNTYLDEDALLGAAAPYFDVLETVNFASTYYVGTRVLKPILAKALNSDIDVADPAAEWNRWWASLPAWGDYGTQKLFVLRRR